MNVCIRFEILNTTQISLHALFNNNYALFVYILGFTRVSKKNEDFKSAHA